MSFIRVFTKKSIVTTNKLLFWI